MSLNKCGFQFEAHYLCFELFFGADECKLYKPAIEIRTPFTLILATRLRIEIIDIHVHRFNVC